MEIIVLRVLLFAGLIFIGVVMYNTRDSKQRFPLEPEPREDEDDDDV